MNFCTTLKKNLKKINHELNHIIKIAFWAIQLNIFNLHLKKPTLYNNVKMLLTFKIKVITNSNPENNNHCIITSDPKTNLKM